MSTRRPQRRPLVIDGRQIGTIGPISLARYVGVRLAGLVFITGTFVLYASERRSRAERLDRGVMPWWLWAFVFVGTALGLVWWLKAKDVHGQWRTRGADRSWSYLCYGGGCRGVPATNLQGKNLVLYADADGEIVAFHHTYRTKGFKTVEHHEPIELPRGVTIDLDLSPFGRVAGGRLQLPGGTAKFRTVTGPNPELHQRSVS